MVHGGDIVDAVDEAGGLFGCLCHGHSIFGGRGGVHGLISFLLVPSSLGTWKPMHMLAEESCSISGEISVLFSTPMTTRALNLSLRSLLA